MTGMNVFTHNDWNAVLPLFIVASSALVVLLADLVSRRTADSVISLVIGAAGLVAGGVAAGLQYGRAYDAFGGGFVLGGFAVVFQEIIVLAALFSLAIYRAQQIEERTAGAVALVLWATAGAMLMAGAANLMTIFLGLELLSLALYCLCGLANRPTSREAALKYLILSSTASGFLLFGMALLFGAAGSVALASLANQAIAANPLYWIGSGLFLVGIAFKLSLMPFHVWTPDVYEGAPLPITAYMTVVTKAATLAVFARFAYAAIPPGAAYQLLMPFYLVAGISMVAGNLGMLAQTDLKRLLAYSGIAQVGYIVAAFAGETGQGVRYAIYYLVAYTFMNLGAFAVVALNSASDDAGAPLAALRGLAGRRPLQAAAMTFFLLALAGFPPTAGFLGKILILATNLEAGFAWLGGLLIAGTAISLYAYFKVIRVMYDRRLPAQSPAVSRLPMAPLTVGICALAVIVMTFYPLTPSNVLPLAK